MKNIIMVGYMGCGKTSVGKKISILEGIKFIDSDKAIEKIHNETIPKIFETKGEKVFREYETEYLRSLKDENETYVLSCGGGIVTTKENIPILKELGTVIFLETEAETILKRLEDDHSRPLLKGGDKREKIKNMLEIRTPMYMEAAELVVKTDGHGVKEIAEEVIKLMSEQVI